MKKVKLFGLSLSALLPAVMLIAGCAGNGNGSGSVSDDDGSGYILKKTTDWEKLNLKDSVEEYIEQDRTSRVDGKTYTKFNEQGYIAEQGILKVGYGGKEYNEVKEIREYDEKNNLLKRRYIDGWLNHGNLADSRQEYREEIYDSLGRVLERWDKNRPSYYNEKEIKIAAYRYEDAGNRTEKVFENDKLIHTVKYDKYRNEISKTAYDNSGNESRLHETKYDGKGNVMTMIKHEVEVDDHAVGTATLLPKHRTVDYEYVYRYDENNRVVRIVKYFGLEKERIKEVSLFSYDENGNDTEHGRYSFECDRHANWFLKYDRKNSGTNTHERQIKYFGEEIQSDEYYD
jgi:hypothetical protein